VSQHHTHKITLLGYAAPGLPLALMGIPLYVYLPPLYASELGLGLGAVGLALMLARFWDVITDPLIGHWADKIPGKARRRILMGAGIPVLLIALWFLLHPSPEVGLVYLYLWGLVAFLGWTMVNIPYQSLNAEAAPTARGRTRLAASREMAALTGVVLAASLPILISSEEPADVLSSVWILMAVLLPLGFALMALSVREQTFAHNQQSWRAGWHLLRENRPLQRLLLGYFINSLANGIPAALFILFINDHLQAEDVLGPLLLLYFASGIIALPLWTLVAHRLGKANSWGISILIAALGFMLVPWIGTGDVWLFAVVCVLTGLSLGADMALPAAIQADLAHHDATENKQARAGLLFGLFGLTTKTALGLAVGLGYGLLALSPYESGVSEHTEYLLWVYGVLPVVIKIFAAWVVLKWLPRAYLLKTTHAI